METVTCEKLIGDEKVFDLIMDGFYAIADRDLQSDECVRQLREMIQVASISGRTMTSPELKNRLMYVVKNYQEICDLFEKKR